MPQLGETVTEGKVIKWLKSAGDAVNSGDNLFEIETDKVSMEVPSIEARVLTEIRVKEGEIAPVGGVVAVIGPPNGAAAPPVASSVPMPAPLAAKPTPAAPKVTAAAASAPRAPLKLGPFEEVRSPKRNFGPAKLPNGVTVTPLARRLAGEGGVALSRLKGSGPHGRIIAGDVEAALSSGAPCTMAPPPASFADPVKSLYRGVPFEEIALDGMRQIVAARLLEAKQTIPYFYVSADADLERLLTLRDDTNAAAPKDTAGNPAFKLSINDLVIKAFAMALHRVPSANAVWAGDRILQFRRVDIGIAVAVDGGLLTPVIRQAETKTVFEISFEMKDLAARARSRRLKPEEYQGGVASVSNLGMYGVSSFSAILNPPQSTILAVGAGQRRPAEIPGGGIRFTTQMTMTLSCDHRVVDGALGAELLTALKSIIENPVSMLI